MKTKIKLLIQAVHTGDKSTDYGIKTKAGRKEGRKLACFWHHFKMGEERSLNVWLACRGLQEDSQAMKSNPSMLHTVSSKDPTFHNLSWGQKTLEHQKTRTHVWTTLCLRHGHLPRTGFRKLTGKEQKVWFQSCQQTLQWRTWSTNAL